MLKNNNFSGSIQISIGENINLNHIKVKNNSIVEKNILPYDLNEPAIKISDKSPNTRLSVADASGGGPLQCAKAVSDCLNAELDDMGIIARASCVLTAPSCFTIIIADCTLHEKNCLGIPKHF